MQIKRLSGFIGEYNQYSFFLGLLEFNKQAASQ